MSIRISTERYCFLNCHIVCRNFDLLKLITYQFRHLCPCLPDQILRSDPDLQAPLSGADINVIELSGGVVDIGREMLFHADGGAAATDVAGEGEEFFDRDHFTAFVAGDFGGLFQIDLVGAGNDTDEVAAFVAVEDKRLEYLRDILA